MRVAIDTNVLISSLIASGGSADQVIQLIREGEVEMVLSNFILGELARVLIQKFELPTKAVENAVDRFRRLAIIVEPRNVVNVIKDKQDDNRILECAVAGRVDYLITGDKKHILPLASFQGIRIVSVAEFLQKYRSVL
jgi:putative PIN family toxin of toxin-antitoxin system